MLRESADRRTWIAFQCLPGHSTITTLPPTSYSVCRQKDHGRPWDQPSPQGTCRAYTPLTNTGVSGGEAVLPAVLVILGVENLLLVLLGGDVVLPLLLTVTVLPTHPAVEVHLKGAGRCAA